MVKVMITHEVMIRMITSCYSIIIVNRMQSNLIFLSIEMFGRERATRVSILRDFQTDGIKETAHDDPCHNQLYLTST